MQFLIYIYIEFLNFNFIYFFNFCFWSIIWTCLSVCLNLKSSRCDRPAWGDPVSALTFGHLHTLAWFSNSSWFSYILIDHTFFLNKCQIEGGLTHLIWVSSLIQALPGIYPEPARYRRLRLRWKSYTQISQHLELPATDQKEHVAGIDKIACWVLIIYPREWVPWYHYRRRKREAYISTHDSQHGQANLLADTHKRSQAIRCIFNAWSFFGILSSRKPKSLEC